MNPIFPPIIETALLQADPSWLPILREALTALALAEPEYLPDLAQDDFLPTEGRMFAAFAQPIDAVRYVLVGEGPYPRAASATGVCFMDGAVGSLWSELADGGLSKAVNRATSLRNFIKMLLVAAGQLAPDQVTPAAISAIAQRARRPGSAITQTLAQLQANLEQQGFLLLNASLVFRAHVPPAKEAKPWQIFFIHVLQGLLEYSLRQQNKLPVLILWGKVAAQLETLQVISKFPQIKTEHPYNLSFIQNQQMHLLFGKMDILHIANEV